MATPLVAAKHQLRVLMKKRLAAVPPESVAAQSRVLFETLRTFQPYQEAKRISVYLSMPGGEIETDDIVRDAISSGKQVYVPFLHKTHLDTKDSPPKLMDMVQLKSVSDYESLKRDRWGIPSIDPSTVHERVRILGTVPDQIPPDSQGLDLILMPAVAFDYDEVTGHIRRLGHGRGFYDLFISRYSRLYGGTSLTETPVLLYGLALKEQFLKPPSDDPIPIGPLDEPPHGVILGDGEIKVTKTKFVDR